MEAFDEADRQAFLRFCWGRSRLPPDGSRLLCDRTISGDGRGSRSAGSVREVIQHPALNRVCHTKLEIWDALLDTDGTHGIASPPKSMFAVRESPA